MGYLVVFMIGAAAGIFAMCLANAAHNNTVDSDQESWCVKQREDARRQKRFSRLFNNGR